MITSQLLEYIRFQLQKGSNPQFVRSLLLSHGWKVGDVNQAFSVLDQSPLPTETAPTGTTFEEPITLIPRLPAQARISTIEQLASRKLEDEEKDWQEISTFESEGESPVTLDGEGKKWRWAVLTVALPVLLIGSFFYYLHRQKIEVQNLVKKQTDNFFQIKTTYTDVATTLTEGVSQEEKPTPLDLESQPAIVTLRRLGGLYEQGGKQTEGIAILNDRVEKRAGAPTLKWFLPQPGILAPKTKEFTDNNRSLFTYLDKENELSLQSVTSFAAIGGAFTTIGIKGVDEATLKQLEDKIASINDLQKEYAALKVASLPREIRQRHQQDLVALPKIKSAFQGIYEALKAQDPEAANRALGNLEALTLEGTIGSEIARVELISFWRDKQRKSTDEVQDEWELFNQKLSSQNIFESLITLSLF